MSRKLFMEFGFRAVSTRRIAETCGITQPTLYHYFKNKEEIYLEVIRTELYEAQIRIEKIVTHYHDQIPECLFQVTFTILHQSPKDLSQMFRDIETELDERHKGTIIKWWQEAYLLPIASVFEEGIKKGEVRNPAQFNTPPITAAQLLLNLINQFAVEPGLTEEESIKFAKEQASLYTNVLLYGLLSSEQ
ncbi:TetR/AcrR family transcriptional regulator [Bacillus sp. FJAT-42376]|uniref:TetR/AcrR family transcriptional regulator n=1 Tax=Bacillus sp. FJAT-42376 TaxID=2014076 RepID=UPI0013DE3F1F|nr:TetR/AcrR family transcriptional regulator [Bacillus sp. FJAT-42376]